MSTARRLRAPVVLPCDAGCSVLRDAVLDIDADGRIGYCGPAADARETSAPLVEYPGILLPGLVNAHAHSPMALLRGMGGDLPLLRWLREVIWPAEAKLTAADCRAGMLLGGGEMLRGGITTSVEMYFHPEALAEAVLEAGSRAVLGGPIIALPGMDWRVLLREIDGMIAAHGMRFGPAERIELSYGAHSAYTLPPEALPEIAGSAREHGALLQIHVAESAGEDTEQRAAYGSVPRMLASLGVLGGRVLAAHGVHLSDADIELFAAHGVAVAHCPGSNAKLASGIARVNDMVTAGIAVGLGTDGPS
ncbi:MAG: amidohydrolase family protein, partial [Sciscionella sp.]